MSLGKMNDVDPCSGYEFCLDVGNFGPLYGYSDTFAFGGIDPDNIAGFPFKTFIVDTNVKKCVIQMGATGTDKITNVDEMAWEFKGFGTPVVFNWIEGTTQYEVTHVALADFIASKNGEKIGANLTIGESLIPIMPDGAGLPYGVTTGTTYFSNAFLPHNAVDENINEHWSSLGDAFPQIVEYDGSSSELQNKGISGGYKITMKNDDAVITSAIKDWTIEALFNDVWTTVDTVVNEPAWAFGETRFYPMDVQLEANGWRIVITDSHGGFYTSFGRLDIRGVFTTTTTITKDILTPIMTSNNTPEGVALATEFSDTREAWECLNRTRTGFNDAWVAGIGVPFPHTFLYTNELTTTFVGTATSFQFANRFPNNEDPNQQSRDLPTDFTLEVSDDGIIWTEVFSVTGVTYEDLNVAKEFKIPLANQVSGTNSYRLVVTATVDPVRFGVILSMFNIFGDLEEV